MTARKSINRILTNRHMSDEVLNRMWVLRNFLSDMTSTEAMEFIRKRMELTRTNEELLVTMDK